MTSDLKRALARQRDHLVLTNLDLLAAEAGIPMVDVEAARTAGTDDADIGAALVAVIRRRTAAEADAWNRLKRRQRATNTNNARRRRDRPAAAVALDASVRRLAKTYRASHPHESARAMAVYIAGKLTRKVSTIRDRMRVLKLR